MSSNQNSTGKIALVGTGLIIVGSLLLSAKGIMAKLLYAHGLTFDALTGIRAIVALPLFWLWGIYRMGWRPLLSVDRAAIAWAMFAGVIGYYAGAMINFYGLTLIDASLERVILYTFPTMVVIVDACLTRRWPQRRVIAATVVTYIGVVLAVGGLDLELMSANARGASVIFISACTTGMFMMFSERVGRRVGSIAFTLYAMTAAAFGLFLHISISVDWQAFSLGRDGWVLLLFMVAFVTVTPMLMITEGVKRIGAQRGAILGTVGPPSTILIAWWILGETMTLPQLGGAGLIIFGIIILESRSSSPPVEQPT